MRNSYSTLKCLFTAEMLAVTMLLAGCGSDQPSVNSSSGPNDRQLFIPAAVENADFSQVTLPVYQGTSQGGTVWYVITDSSDQADAQARGVNFAPKLANAKGTSAVQFVTINNGVINFPATVNFGQQRVLTAGPNVYPPAQATPGSTGQSGYSPLIQMPDGMVLNASQVANASGMADKVVSLDTTARTVTYRETRGFFANRVAHYISLDASAAVSATLEDITLAPALGAAPMVNSEDSTSTRETIVPFTNGQTGVNNPQRQGLNATILDGMNPFSILDAAPPTANGPGSTAYSPVWDVTPATWSASAVSLGQNTRQTSVAAVRALAQQGLITSPSGGAFGGSGPASNCPFISLDAGS